MRVLQRKSAVVTLLCSATLLLAACGETAAPAEPGQTYTLRVADLYPSSHEVPSLFKKYFMDEVESQSNGRITFDYQGGEVLMKSPDMPQAVSSGLVDMANTIRLQDQFTEASFMFLPGTFSDPKIEAFAKATWPVYRDFLNQKSEPQGLKVLAGGFTSNYQLAGVGTAPTAADLSGQKIRVSGNVLPVAIAALKGTSVNISANEAYDAMGRGVISGVGLAIPAYAGYKLPEIMKWAVINADMGSAIYSYGINKAKFDSMPADLQKILVDVGNSFAAKASADYGKVVEAELAEWRSANIQLVEWSAADRDKAATAMVAVWHDWIEKSKPKVANLHELLTAWQANLAKEGIPLSAPLAASIAKAN